MLFDSFLSLVWDGSILCRFVEAYSVTQHFYGNSGIGNDNFVCINAV